MTLLEAFRRCGPVVGDRPEDRARNEASTVVFEELQRLGPRVIGRREDVDDAISIVSLRLIKGGPRGTRPDDPQSDDAVRGYLVNGLKNAVRDVHRREATARAFSETAEVHAAPDPESELRAKRLEAELDEARRQLREDIVPGIAARLRRDAAEASVRSAEELRQLAEGETTFEALVRREFADCAERHCNAVQQRHSRTRRRLIEEISARFAAGHLTAARHEALMLLLESFKRRA